MNTEQLKALLDRHETANLDWKATLPRGLGGRSSDPEWDVGRGELLRDMVAIANTVSGQSGYIVYGVKDLGATRKVVGVSAQLDDADLQQWSENHFDPPVRFEFALIHVGEAVVAVLEIFSDPGRPHVVVRTLGPIHEGQVWFRRGTKNTVAMRPDLVRFFHRSEPLRVDVNSPQVASISKHYTERGYTLSFVRFLEKDSKNAVGRSVAADPETGAEVWAGGTHDRPELILMKTLPSSA